MNQQRWFDIEVKKKKTYFFYFLKLYLKTSLLKCLYTDLVLQHHII